jgi:hypothetical protein
MLIEEKLKDFYIINDSVRRKYLPFLQNVEGYSSQ